MKRELRDVEKAGGSVYGTCPEGHGDEQGEIAAEVSEGRRYYPNCPICASRLEETYEVQRQ